MQVYDDYAINPQSFEIMAKEFSRCQNSEIFSASKNKIVGHFDEEPLFKKLEYLKVLLQDLKTRTSNRDVLLVLEGVFEDVKNQTKTLQKLFENASMASFDKPNVDMFCNNLKLAINTTGEIVKLLISVKDNESVTYDAKLVLTDTIFDFLDINNSLVSLFGECRYLTFAKFPKKS